MFPTKILFTYCFLFRRYNSLETVAGKQALKRSRRREFAIGPEKSGGRKGSTDTVAAARRKLSPWRFARPPV
jgi:hypothetical protein